MSPLSNTPDSTHQLVSRDCKNWIGCVWLRRHTECAGHGVLQDRFGKHWFIWQIVPEFEFDWPSSKSANVIILWLIYHLYNIWSVCALVAGIFLICWTVMFYLLNYCTKALSPGISTVHYSYTRSSSPTFNLTRFKMIFYQRMICAQPF